MLRQQILPQPRQTVLVAVLIMYQPPRSRRPLPSLPLYPPSQYLLQPPVLPTRILHIAAQIVLNLKRALGRARQRLNPHLTFLSLLLKDSHF